MYPYILIVFMSDFTHPTYGSWQRDEFGLLNAIFPRNKSSEKWLMVGVGKHGSGGPNPKSVLEWADFVALSDKQKKEIYNSIDVAVKPPEKYANQLIDLITDFTNPYERKGKVYYNKFKSNFSEDNYENYNPDQKNNYITTENIDNIIDRKDRNNIQSIESGCIYFVEPGTVTVFDEPENRYRKCTRISIPKIRMVDIENYKTIPFNMQNSITEKELIEFEKRMDIWVQNHPESTVRSIQKANKFITMFNNE